MLERIGFIKNIGLFADHTQEPGTDFTDLTLIFGENGVGKTTIAAIVDSLRESTAVTITRRRSLPGHEVPTCSVCVDGTEYRFDGAGWDGQPAFGTIEVFFPDFVSRNVHAGGGVNTDQKRNLCEFVRGRQAVADVEELSKADAETRTALSDSKQVDDKLRLLIKTPDNLQDFLALTEDPKIDEKITAARAALAEAAAAEKVTARAVPKAVGLHPPDKTLLTEVLALTDEDVGADVAAVIAGRTALLGERGEAWLDHGAQHIVDEHCPFCGQDVAGVKLVEDIVQYFSAAYRELVAAMNEGVSSLRDAAGQSVFDGVRSEVRAQLAVAASWTDQYTIDEAAVEKHLGAAETAWSRGAAQLEALLSAKQSSPIDVVSAEDAETALALFDAATAHVDAINAMLTTCATAAETHKKTVASADKVKLELEVNHLENQKMRFSNTVKDLLAERAKHLQRRTVAQQKKDRLKTAIDAHASAVVGKYEGGINYYLQHFGCDIRIGKVGASYQGGKASVSYKLTVRGHDIPLGSATDDPCFDSILSEGDKCSLALAFFLARLKDVPDLTGRIIVLDDPVSSLGGSRRRLVEGVIRDLHKRGAQVVVLTHDERLAAMLWRHSMKIKSMKNIMPLQVERAGAGSRIVPWNAEKATRSEYVEDYLTLNGFLEGSIDHTEAAPSIRPYVEQRLRHLFPGPPFETRDTLGVMIRKIREASPGERLHDLQGKLPELDAIADAGLPAGHATDDVAGMPPLSREELRIFAQKALDVLP
ncbi:MAG: AAA family ATPase [Coriobacteriia bacterium]|nr:AAA family ATPase [Coriobacteriia bacterium]